MSSGQAWCADPENANALKEADERRDERETSRRHLIEGLVLEDITDAEVLTLFRRARAAAGYTLRRDQMRDLAAALRGVQS